MSAVITVAGAMPALPALGQEIPLEEPLARELIQLEREMMVAVRDHDRDVLERVIADDFLLTSSESNGPLAPKQAYIRTAMDEKLLTVDSFRFHDFRIRVYGDVALVHSRLDWRSTFLGQPWISDFLMTDVWVRRDGRWQIVSRHASYPVSQVFVKGRDDVK